MIQNPFRKPGVGLDIRSIRNALSDISSDIEKIQELIETYERTSTLEKEMQLSLALSGLEIKQTNFAQSMREAFE